MTRKTHTKKFLRKSLIGFLLLTSLLSCSSNKDDTLVMNDLTTVSDVLNTINFSGFAIVTQNGNDLVRQGFGWANESTAMPQDAHLAYRIGSVSKTLTAAAIIQLKRDGLITSLDQTLDEFDPEFPVGNQITIAHLLSHQSGIPEYQLVVEQLFDQGEDLDEGDVYEVIKELISQNGLDFTPGTSKAYGNSNFLIAALLIQEISGMNFHQYVQQKIFNPLGMDNTFKGANSIDPQSHAEGYQNGTPKSNYPMTIAFGSGDFSSSPIDMEKWINAVNTHWFTETEKGEIFAQNVPNGFVDFGLGWFTTQEANKTMYWHGGDINGYWSMIGFVPEHNVTIVLLSNHQDDFGNQRNAFIEALLTNILN